MFIACHVLSFALVWTVSPGLRKIAIVAQHLIAQRKVSFYQLPVLPSATACALRPNTRTFFVSTTVDMIYDQEDFFCFATATANVPAIGRKHSILLFTVPSAHVRKFRIAIFHFRA
jgi:hypothetical protein